MASARTNREYNNRFKHTVTEEAADEERYNIKLKHIAKRI